MRGGATTPPSDKRGKHNIRPHAYSEDDVQLVKNHIENIIKYRSRYSRKGNGSISEDRECGSEMCMVRAARQDVDESDDRFQIATLVWQKSKPPIGFSLSPPIVSARRAQVTRAHLQGELEGPLSLPTEPVISTLNPLQKQELGTLSRPLSCLDLMRSSAQVCCSCARSGTAAMRTQGRRDLMRTYENTENHPSTNVLFQSQSVFHSSKTSQTR